MLPSWQAGLDGSTLQSSLPRTIPWPTMCSSAGCCSCLMRCSVASPSFNNCALGIHFFTSRASNSASSNRSRRSARNAPADATPADLGLAPGLTAMTADVAAVPVEMPVRSRLAGT